MCNGEEFIYERMLFFLQALIQFVEAHSLLLNPPALPPLPHTNKKQSKFAPEELEVRGQMVTQMLTEIQELKEVSLAGYIRKGNFNGNAMAGMIVPMEESDAFKGPMGKCMHAVCV